MYVYVFEFSVYVLVFCSNLSAMGNRPATTQATARQPPGGEAARRRCRLEAMPLGSDAAWKRRTTRQQWAGGGRQEPATAGNEAEETAAPLMMLFKRDSARGA